MSREVEMQCNQVDVTLAFKLMQYVTYRKNKGNLRHSPVSRQLIKIAWQPNFGLQHKGYKSLI